MRGITVSSKDIEKLLSYLTSHKAYKINLSPNLKHLFQTSLSHTLEPFSNFAWPQKGLWQNQSRETYFQTKCLWYKKLCSYTVFLDNRNQSVIAMDLHPNLYLGYYMQGSVLGPLFCPIVINDLPQNVKSKLRLFVDDTAMPFILPSQP